MYGTVLLRGDICVIYARFDTPLSLSLVSLSITAVPTRFVACVQCVASL